MEHLDWSQAAFLDSLEELHRRRGYEVDFQPGYYPADFLPLTAGATQEFPVTIDPDSDFVLCQQMGVYFDNAGITLAAPNVLVEMRSEANQRDLQNQPVHLMGIFGTGERPYVYYRPLILRARGTLFVRLQSLSGGDINIRLTFGGVKAYLKRR